MEELGERKEKILNAIIQNYLYMEPVVFVQWKMTGERPLPPVQKNQKTEWSSIRIHQG